MDHKYDYVDMTDVIGTLAIEHGLPYMRFDKLVELGKYTALVYGLNKEGTRIPFAVLCEYIEKYIATPFGAKVARELTLV